MKIFLPIVIFIAASSVTFAQFQIPGLPVDPGDVIKGAGGAKKIAKGGLGISLKEELDIGGSLAVEIAAKYGGILKDAEQTKRVAIIGKALAQYCTRPELPWMFAILDNPTVNAFSCPGGYVFVTKGLLDSCKNDNQLASVLAHEIAHVSERHALRAIAGKEGTQGLIEVGSVISGNNIGGFDDLVEKGMNSILDKGYEPRREFDADRLGTRLLYDTGFPPKTLRDYLSSLKTDEPPFSNHPSTEDRVERLDGELKRLE
jgi:beta-barrel assembly-enhancing protease